MGSLRGNARTPTTLKQPSTHESQRFWSRHNWTLSDTLPHRMDMVTSLEISCEYSTRLGERVSSSPSSISTHLLVSLVSRPPQRPPQYTKPFKYIDLTALLDEGAFVVSATTLASGLAMEDSEPYDFEFVELEVVVGPKRLGNSCEAVEELELSLIFREESRGLLEKLSLRTKTYGFIFPSKFFSLHHLTFDPEELQREGSLTRKFFFDGIFM